jgi:hypothetical protein
MSRLGIYKVGKRESKVIKTQVILIIVRYRYGAEFRTD